MKKIAFFGAIFLALIAGGISYYGASLSSRGVAVSPALSAAPALALTGEAASLVPSGTVSVSPISGNTAAVGAAKSVKVSWNASDYPSKNVSITLIRKSGDKPSRYENVRTLTASTPNTGSFPLTLTSAEAGQTLLVQIGCVAATSGCQARMVQI